MHVVWIWGHMLLQENFEKNCLIWCVLVDMFDQICLEIFLNFRFLCKKIIIIAIRLMLWGI